MNGWRTRRIAVAMLMSFSVWAGAADTAQQDKEVPAPLTPAPAADAVDAEPMPMASLEPEPMPAVRPESLALAAGAGRADRLELDSTSIRGNQELPKVLYIVPWKDPELGDLVGKPVNSLVDEVLAPVDREVFRRQIRYFDQLYGEAGEPSAGPAGP